MLHHTSGLRDWGDIAEVSGWQYYVNRCKPCNSLAHCKTGLPVPFLSGRASVGILTSEEV